MQPLNTTFVKSFNDKENCFLTMLSEKEHKMVCMISCQLLYMHNIKYILCMYQDKTRKKTGNVNNSWWAGDYT